MTMTSRHPVHNQAGFSLIELMVSMAIMLTVSGAVFQMVGSGQSSFRTQPAVADVHQRLRVAADRLYKDLLSAGAGPYLGVNPGAALVCRGRLRGLRRQAAGARLSSQSVRPGRRGRCVDAADYATVSTVDRDPRRGFRRLCGCGVRRRVRRRGADRPFRCDEMKSAIAGPPALTLWRGPVVVR